MPEPTSPAKPDRLGLLVRVGVYILLAILGLTIFPTMINFALGGNGYLVTAALGTFAAAAVTNAITVRIYERGRLADIGLGWNAASGRNLALGAALGVGAALCVVLLPVLARYAVEETDPSAPAQWRSFVFLSLILLFGAVGEEMLFRGYGFQVMVRTLGPFATILPVSILFGLAHGRNQNVSPLALFNTILWGVLLGYAFVRSGDLWLPIGLHFGWNWCLPLLGVNLSGYTMNVTGYSVHWRLTPLWTGGAYGPEGGLLTTCVAAGLLAILHRTPVRKTNDGLLGEGYQDV